jgi:hypothetical protein
VLGVDAGVHVALAHPHVDVLAPGDAPTWAPRNMSGRNSTSRSGSIAFTTSTALPLVQQ